MTHAEYKNGESLGDAMHTYGLIWTADRLMTYIDNEENVVLDVDMSGESFWSRGGFEGENPWRNEPNAAPFNQEFYLIFNVAAGGTNGYFVDDKCGKPWSNESSTSVNEFYDDVGNWFETWNYPMTNDSAMKIDSVKVWSFDESTFLQ